MDLLVLGLLPLHPTYNFGMKLNATILEIKKGFLYKPFVSTLQGNSIHMLMGPKGENRGQD